MSDNQPATGIKKRQQIEGTRKQVFAWVALASAAAVVCLTVGLNLFSRLKYQWKVNSELAATEKALKSSSDSVDDLIKNVDALRANSQLTLPNLKSDDSTVFQVIIDALPTTNDSVDLSSSLQNKVLVSTGVSIESISVDSETTTTTAADTQTESSSSDTAFPKANPITFSIELVGPYDSIKAVLEDIERTIRPIVINEITLEGSDSRMTASISATTYYSESVNYTVGSKEVPYEEK